ncbi:succinylglutamate desuccinylase [Burkholderiaceae bacterium DAT-1]|nr:succinylglutamate desuccinylase [Burkholderiaceae bacterium DAT-1]
MTPWLQSLLNGTATNLPGELPDGVTLRILAPGVLAFEPKLAPLGEMLLSCGIHGNETAPIELVDQLLADLLNGTQTLGVRLLMVFGNLEAIRVGKRYLDDDLNRLFGKPVGSESVSARHRIDEIESACRAFFGTHGSCLQRFHYDLHTAIRDSAIEQFAISPFRTSGRPALAELQRLGACGIRAVLQQGQLSPTFSCWTANTFGLTAFTLELGKARPFGHNQCVNLTPLHTVLVNMLSGDFRINVASPMPERFRVVSELIKQSEQFRLHLPDDVANFYELPSHYLLAQDGEHSWRTDRPGLRIIFPNAHVKPGLRAGLLIEQSDHE